LESTARVPRVGSDGVPLSLASDLTAFPSTGIRNALREIRKVIGEIPILAAEQRLLDEAEAADEPEEKKQADAAPKAVTTTRVLADGTYATETVYTSSVAQARLEQVKAAAKPPLRALILSGDFYTGTVLATTLTKLVLRYADTETDQSRVNAIKAEVCGLALLLIHIANSSPHRPCSS
jgi:coatomer subunit beta